MRRLVTAALALLVTVACAPKAEKSGNEIHAHGRSHGDATSTPAPERDLSGSDTSVDPATAICGEVRIKPELSSKLNTKSVLFVFAKPNAGGGAPAAVIRRDAPVFPAKFCLSQKNAMAPSVVFAGAQYLTARVEFDTSAGGQPGDLETVTKDPVAVGTKDLVLTIDTVRP